MRTVNLNKKSEDETMNIARYPFKIILLLVSLGIPFTVSADAASDTSAAVAADPNNAAAIASTSIAANPGQSAAITAAAVKAAPESAAAITAAAITAAPTQAAAITVAAVAAAPTRVSAIRAAAIKAAPKSTAAILTALDLFRGAPIPAFKVSESTIDNTAMQVDVIIAAIEKAHLACGNNAQCKTQATEFILSQVSAQVENPEELALIKKGVEPVVSPN